MQAKCNSLLVNNTSRNIILLQRVQNNLARVILWKSRRTSAAPLIHHLHWLRINERIQYKLASITFNAIKIGQPSYLSELLHIHVPTRSLQSESHLMLNVPFA